MSLFLGLLSDWWCNFLEWKWIFLFNRLHDYHKSQWHHYFLFCSVFIFHGSEKDMMTWWDPLRYTSGHDGSMCNADQCGSMCDQTSYIDPKCFSIKINANQCGSILLNFSQCRSMRIWHWSALKSIETNWEELIHIDWPWSILRNIGMNAWHLIAHWSTLIGIAHWSIMSWYIYMSCHFHSQFCSVCLNFLGNPSKIHVVRPRCLPSRICLSELAGFPPGPSHGYLPELSSYPPWVIMRY